MRKQNMILLLIILFVVVAGVALALAGFFENKQAGQQADQTVERTFVDVRTNEEWQAGHLEGAIHFELARLEAGETPDLAKDTPISLYCRSGSRAGVALQILKQQGFTDVVNAGGYEDVKKSGI